jgi:diguanylate cyclase (GGDEF)-like protein
MSIAAPGRLIRILVVDDTPTIRLLFQRMFTASGVFEVVGEAANGHEGVELAKRHQPDVILLDLAMPVVNGFQAIPSLVAECPDSLIIVLSGFNADSAGEQALALGAHAYIEKRHRPDELLRQIVDIYRSRMASRLVGTHEVAPASWIESAPIIEPATIDKQSYDDNDARTERAGHENIDPAEHLPVVRQLESTNAELARSNAGLATFAAVAAHDLRSPLHVVVGFSELLASAYNDRLDADGREMIKSIVSSAHRMEQMIEALLAHSRLDGAAAVTVDVVLDDVVASATSTMAADIAQRRAVVTKDALPTVVGDPLQLQILVQNLLANALRFCSDDVVPHVHFSSLRTEDGWRITIDDNGIGIDPSKREQIFGMFVRLHTQGEYEGTGIGLASCKRIVEAHGGTIWVEDNPTGGSRFIVDLPDRSVDDGPHPEPIADVVDEEERAAPERPLDVLLVEDSPDHARLINALLRRAPSPGYRLHHVGTVGEARDLLATTEMDCVLLDLSLPDADNLEALGQVRAAATSVAIVVITSSADEALAFAAVSQGAQDYLVKGHIDSEQLSRAIRWAVQRKTLENELTRDALHDPLTRLPNRTLMLDRLASALARSERSGKKVVVFFMDLDGFKSVNDRFGHEAGDQFLSVMAGRLRGAVRPQDTVARIGGDEFVIICEGFNGFESEWQPLQRRLIAAVEIPMELAGHAVRVSASIGLAVGGRECDPESMLRDADLAMYAMKRLR